MHVESITFETSSGCLSGDVYHASEYSGSGVLFIHGGGMRGRKGFEVLRKQLALSGVTSYAFDFVGHGETGGSLASSSLEKRVQQSSEIIKHFFSRMNSVTLIASSMSGYIAVKVLEICDIHNLIMLAPAVYTKEAYTVPFGQNFSSIIRSPLSWEKTDAWKSIGQFSGNLLIFQAEKDQVIPKGLIDRLYEESVSVKSKKNIIFKNATHPLTDWLTEHPEELKITISEIVALVKV